jgi:hypothetical protein
MNISRRTRWLAPLLAAMGALLVLGGSAQAAASKPAGMSKAEYRALMLRGQALNEKYGLGASQGVANRIVDEPTTNRITDDYFRDAQRSVNASPPVTNRIVDDYFRDAAPAVASANGFHWGAFGIGIAVAFGAMLLLAGVGAVALAVRQTRSRKTGPAPTVQAESGT